jgi:hypothetical protein
MLEGTPLRCLSQDEGLSREDLASINIRGAFEPPFVIMNTAALSPNAVPNNLSPSKDVQEHGGHEGPVVSFSKYRALKAPLSARLSPATVTSSH